MTRDEAAKALALIQLRYPNANLGDPGKAPDVWQMTLDDVPYPAIDAALRSWFKREKWPPDPAELRSLILEGLDEVPDVGDAWSQVQSHIRGTYGGFGASNPPFRGPACVAQAVQAIGGWRQLRMSEEPERDRAAFFKVYPVYAKRAGAAIDIAAAIEAGEPVAITGGR